eukprot:scaffold12871_cov76-Phaeocystis_antarctica.AAC.6
MISHDTPAAPALPQRSQKRLVAALRQRRPSCEWRSWSHHASGDCCAASPHGSTRLTPGGPQASSEAAAQRWPAPDPRRHRPWRRSSRVRATRPLACSPAASEGRGQVAGGAPAYRSSSLTAQRHTALCGRAARRRSGARLPWDAALRRSPTARTAREWPLGRTGQ